MSFLTDKSTHSRYSLRADGFGSRPQVCLQECHRLAHRLAHLALSLSRIQRTISPPCLELRTAASCGQSQTLSIYTLFSSCSLGTCLWGDQSSLSLEVRKIKQWGVDASAHFHTYPLTKEDARNRTTKIRIKTSQRLEVRRETREAHQRPKIYREQALRGALRLTAIRGEQRDAEFYTSVSDPGSVCSLVELVFSWQ